MTGGRRDGEGSPGVAGCLVRGSRYPLRLLVAILAVLSAVGTVAGAAGVIGAVSGAVLGVIGGEVVGRASRVRTPVLVSGLVAIAVAGGAVGRVLVAWPFVPALLGPAAVLSLREAIVLGTLSGTVLAGLRLLAVRRPAWRFVEIAVLSFAFVLVFSAHRGGRIARPLWLSDWVWRIGFDPANALLAIGAAFGVICGTLLLLESRHRLSAVTVAALPLVGLVLLSVVDPRDLGADPAADLAALQDVPPSEGSRDIDQDIPITIGHGDPPQSTGSGVLPGPGPGEAGGGRAGGGEVPEGGGSAGASGGGPAGAGDEVSEGGAPAGEGAPTPGAGAGGTQGGGADGGSSDGGADGAQGGGADGGSSDGGADGGAPGSEDGDPSGEGPPAGGTDEGSSVRSGWGPPPETEDLRGDADGLSVADQPEMSFSGQQRGQGASIAAVVVFRDDYRTPSGYYYFRQQAHSAFDGHRLVPTTRDDADRDVAWAFPTRIQPVGDPPPWPLRTRVRARVALLGEHDGPFALESPALFLPATNPNPDRFVAVYAFESYAQELPYDQLVGRTAGDPGWPDDLRDHYLTAPADPRYRALVDEILGALPDDARADPFTRALAIKVWLDERMIYSYSRRYPDADDPTAAFLFGGDELVGYCVHSAHAAVYLWRLAGIPARMGTGYLVEESARRGSSLLVMGGDAHAWPELYLDGVGWIPLDITPAQTLDPPPDPVDGALTAVLGEMVREAEEEPEPGPEPIRFGLWLRRLLGLWIAALVVGGLGAHYAVKAWRRVRPYLTTRAGLPRTGYRAALDRLAEVGWVRAEGETREAFARRVGAVVPAFVPLTDLHVAHALNDPARRSGEDPDAWRRLLAEFDDQIRAVTPWWRRLLGLLDPTSVHRAR